MNELALKALATVILVAALIFGFNVFVDHQRDIGYQKRVAEDAVQLSADLLKRLIPFAVAAAIGFGVAWAIQGLRITAAEQETVTAEQAHKDYVQQLTQEAQDAKDEADRQREQAQRDYATASQQLEDALARGDALSRCIAAGKCRGMPKQPVCAGSSTPGLQAPSGIDDSSADAVFAAASVADEGVIADCARTTLQINQLQADIKAQAGYEQ